MDSTFPLHTAAMVASPWFTTPAAFVLQRCEPPHGGVARHTIHANGMPRLMTFERRANATAYHAALVRYYNQTHRLPTEWPDVKDLVDQFYWKTSNLNATALDPCPLAIATQRLDTSVIARFLLQNSLGCVAVRSIQHRGGRHTMTYAFIDPPEPDVEERRRIMESMYALS